MITLFDYLIQIDKEKSRLLGSAPVKEELKKFKDKLDEKKFNDPEYRLEIREILRNIIDRIVVDTEAKTYQVWFHCSNEPVEGKMN